MNPALILALMQGVVELTDHIAARQAGGGQLDPAYVASREKVADALDALADSLALPPKAPAP